VPVPPEAEAVADPLFAPLQETFVWETEETEIAVGCVIFIVLVPVHPLPSVTVHVHDPAVRPETLVVPSPVGFPGVQLYDKLPVPPDADTEADPLFPPLQDGGEMDAVSTLIAGGCVIVIACIVVQPFSSLT
jgi:hypothetical protein